MVFQVELVGMDALAAMIAKAQKSQTALAKAVHSEAQTVLNESKKIVPVDLGVLKNSGQVKEPKIDGNSVEVEVTYGGAAAPYALYVHEDPEARHAPGKTYKYLEIPVMAHADKFARNVKMKWMAYMRAGG